MPGYESEKVRRSHLGLVTSLVAIILIASEVHFEPVRAFWSEHPMTAAMTGFCVTLALSALVIQDYIDRRTRQQWSFIGNIAIRRLSVEAFRVCTTLIDAVGPSQGQADRMIAAFELLAASGQRPGIEQDVLLPDDFEAALSAVLGETELRSELAELVDDLSYSLDPAMTEWAPILTQTRDLSQALETYAMMRESLHWLRHSLEHEGTELLPVWNNLRVYLLLVAGLDTMRRRTTGDPLLFGFEAEELDRAWGLPFSVQIPYISSNRTNA